jgi:putative ABC transport system permease protein
MTSFTKMRGAFRFPWRSAAQIDRDLDDELRFHMEARLEELRANGLSEEDAHREAMRRFGDMDDARHYCRAADRRRGRAIALREWIESWGQDIRYAVRQLARTPGFTLIAVITLGLGIGANTAIFSVVRRLMFEPFPFADASRLVWIIRAAENNQMLVSPSPKLIELIRARSHTLQGISQFASKEVTLGSSCASSDCETELTEAGQIEPGLPAALGVRPLLGRPFAPDEAKVGGPPVVLIGYGLWQRRLGRDPDVLGKTLELDGIKHTIVGVMPRDFDIATFGPGDTPKQLWLPLVPDPGEFGTNAIAMLRPGIESAEATKELTAIMASMSKEEPAFEGWSARAMTARDFLDRRAGVKETLLTLLGAVGVVLLIACANLANLLLARATTRQRELAVRAAIGAGRARLVRQLLTESVCLAIIGGAVGMFIAWRGLALIISMRPPSLSDLDTVRLDPLMLALTAGLSVGTGLLFGLAPALLGTMRGVGEILKDAGRSVAGGTRGKRFRSALVAAQVALSVTLLIGAGLLMRTVSGLQRIELGFDPRGLTSMHISMPEARYKTAAQRVPILDELLLGVKKLPGVTDAMYSSGPPPKSGIMFAELQVEGQPLPEKPAQKPVPFAMVQPEYFKALNLRFREGSTFAADTSNHPVIINHAMAAKYWPSSSAIGRRIKAGDRVKGEWRTVVGVVDDVRLPSRTRGNVEEHLYYPFAAAYEGGTLIIKSAPGAPALLPQVTRLVARLDPLIKIRDVQVVQSRVDNALAGPRFTMTLLATFALIALVLSAVGLYGVIAYSVAQRTREIGVRIALGAQPASVLRLIVGNGMRLAIAGVVLGLLLAAGLTRTLRTLLYDVSPLDPLTFSVVGVLLGGVALVASWMPARTAARVDPAVALRAE